MDKEWLHHPETREFIKRIEDLQEQANLVTTLDPDNADATQARTAKKEGKLEAFIEVLDELREY